VTLGSVAGASAAEAGPPTTQHATSRLTIVTIAARLTAIGP